MPLSEDQVKAIIASQIKNYRKRLEELATELAVLRSQPISGSRELRKRLSYIESAQTEQQARLAALLDLQQILQTLEGYAEEGE
jgi:Lon protease-like protein